MRPGSLHKTIQQSWTLAALSLPALLFAGATLPAGASPLEAADSAPPPPGIGLQPGTTQVTQHHDIAPLDGHSIAVGPSAVFSWSGLTLNQFAAYPDSADDNRQRSALAPGFTPLPLDFVQQDPFRLGSDSVESNAEGRSESSFSRDRVGIGISQSFGGWRVSVTGNYGILTLPVGREVDVAEEQDLLRVGANLEFAGLSLRGSMGADVKPFKVGRTLAWDLAAALREGAWSFNLAYTHSILAEGPTQQHVETLGTLQGGIGLEITPDITASASAMFWTFTEESGSSATDVGGLLGLSMRF